MRGGHQDSYGPNAIDDNEFTPPKSYPSFFRRRKGNKKRKRGGRHHPTDEMPEQVKEHVKPPASIPYTTPASEFIYGANAVEAALRCSRRHLYKLYIYQAASEALSPQKITIRKLALSRGVPVKMAFGLWDRLLDQVSEGRAHNGCVLETSHLPRLPVESLKRVTSPEDDHFRVSLAPQSREEAVVNGTSNMIPVLPTPVRNQNRYPVALLFDGITDPGNLGAMIRSAYYLGIDAVIFAGRNSAPLSPVAIKSSAGAAENMTILEVKNEVAFIKQSKENGWRFYAADAPGPGATQVQSSSTDGGDNHGGSPLNQSPSVLMLGSEGSGLSKHIKNQADAIVSIPGVRKFTGDEFDPARVDSLNVSVAAALLMEKFLLVPVEMSPVRAWK